jgi:O-succinylbenzoic acid--CoA ligase
MLCGPDHPLSWLAGKAEADPDLPYLTDGRGQLRYGELWSALGAWYAAFDDVGMANGELVAVLTRDRRRMSLAVWLAFYAGFPVLPLDPERPVNRSLLQTLGIRQVVADEGIDLPEAVRTLPAAAFDEIPRRAPRAPSPRSPQEAHLLVATSGTEGRPKAVMLSAAALAASASASCRLFGLGAGDRWLCCLPVVHVGGLMILLRCARAGAVVELRQRFDPAGTADDLARGATHTSLSPTMLHCILDVSGAAPAPATLRHVLIGGAPLPRALAARARAAGWPLSETYGMTETATHIALVDSATRELRPLAGCEIDLVDLGAATGEPGRLRLKGPTLMLGYANRDLTPGDGLDRSGGLLTADLGREAGDGMIRLVGREDDVIICGGLNIHPAVVEQLLAACPGIGEIAVTGRDDPVWGQQLAALYTGPAAAGDCVEWVARNVPGRFRPRAWQHVGALPKSGLGKLERSRLSGLLCPDRMLALD